MCLRGMNEIIVDDCKNAILVSLVVFGFVFIVTFGLVCSFWFDLCLMTVCLHSNRNSC